MTNDESRQDLYERARTLLAEQNFAAAIIAGTVSALLAAVAYGIAVESWPHTHGFAAAGVGCVVGLSMGFLGRGVTTRFDVAAASFTLMGCLLGNLFVIVINHAKAAAISPLEVLEARPVSAIAAQALAGLTFLDLVYWLVAVVCAVFLARRALSRHDRFALGVYEGRD